MKSDESMDRLLQRTSGAGDRARSLGPCLDAEFLAAFSHGTLSDEERTLAEAHLADCDRCLSILAAMAKAAPSVPPTTSVRWFSIKWLMPLATAAVALTAWVLVRDTTRTPDPPNPPAAQAKTEAVKPAEPVAPPQRDPRADSKADDFGQRRTTPRGQLAARPSESDRRSAESLAKQSADAAKPSEMREEVRPSAPAPSAGRPLADTAAPAAASAPAPPRASPESSSTRTVAEDLDARQRFARQGPTPVVVVAAADSNSLWRVSGTLIERSSDGGRSWREQRRLETPGILAGSSPAPPVCWLVGQNGLVLLSTDGDTWQVRTFDPSIHLVRVVASDRMTATVTAADGRSFQTNDGGLTWTAQENSRAPF